MPVMILHTPQLSAASLDQITEIVPGELEPCEGFHRLHHKQPASTELVGRLRRLLDFDINPLPPGFIPTEVRLLVSDMDSTLISIECVDEIADFANLKPQVAAITAAAMRGEIDFAESLRQRVALLEGLEETVLERVYTERLRLNPGAEALLTGLRRRGIRTALVSGGFTFFTDRLQLRLHLDYTLANKLAVRGGKLVGRVEGDIVGAEAKRAFLLERCEELGISPRQAIAVGDGANDLEMMRVAGVSVAYRAKRRVQEQADVVLNHSGLDAILHLLGEGA